MSKTLTKGAQTRERIIAEALALFAERGTDNTSLKDIAAKVGISEPAVYRHFASKAELVWQIFSDAVFHIYGRLAGKMSAYRQTLSAAAWAAISFAEIESF
jgi:AcrR family transcriptional regulator